MEAHARRGGGGGKGKGDVSHSFVLVLRANRTGTSGRIEDNLDKVASRGTRSPATRPPMVR